MKKFSVFLILFITFFFFNVCTKVEASAVPISEGSIDEYDIELFINYAKTTRGDEGITCNIYGGKFYKDKGVTYWTANFGQNKNSFIKFKFNNSSYIDWVTITRYMPNPTQNAWQEYAMETVTSLKEINAITDAFMEEIMLGYYRDLDMTLVGELIAALQKIKYQVEDQGKVVTPYDHTSSVYVGDVKKTFNIRVYGGESLIHIAITAQS